MFKKTAMKKNTFKKKKIKNLIRNILQQEIWIFNVKVIHNAQNHGLVHFNENYIPLKMEI